MYQIGQRVVYGACGVCRVTDQKEEKGKQYLVLSRRDRKIHATLCR